MAGFTMCDACAAEYADPSNRRFHAQPNACPECGPRLSHALDEIVALLRDGGIAAVKGIGGYHLACVAGDEEAVARLRARKHREEKPFALMAGDVEAARELVELGRGGGGAAGRARPADRARPPPPRRARGRGGGAAVGRARRDAPLQPAPSPAARRRRASRW